MDLQKAKPSFTAAATSIGGFVDFPFDAEARGWKLSKQEEQKCERTWFESDSKHEATIAEVVGGAEVTKGARISEGVGRALITHSSERREWER
jgi:hypothetical protein